MKSSVLTLSFMKLSSPDLPLHAKISISARVSTFSSISDKQTETIDAV